MILLAFLDVFKPIFRLKARLLRFSSLWLTGWRHGFDCCRSSRWRSKYLCFRRGNIGVIYEVYQSNQCSGESICLIAKILPLRSEAVFRIYSRLHRS